jgi:hypothetical protein
MVIVATTDLDSQVQPTADTLSEYGAGCGGDKRQAESLCIKLNIDMR